MPKKAQADDPTVVAEWRDRVERWRASGQKMGEFAASEGVKVRQITWWVGEFGRIAKGLPRSRGSGPRRKRPTFVALKVGGTSGTSGTSSTIEVLLPGGVALRVARDFDEDTLRRLMATLRGA